MESFGVKERLLKYLAYKNIPVSSFEKTCGLSNGYVNSIRTSIQPDRLKEIAIKFPDLNISWLLIGETNGENMERGWISDADKNLLLDENCTIPLIPVDAVAGFGAMTYEDQAISDYYNVREFRGSDFLIRVKGDSMYPKFTTGDVVACKLVKERLFFQWGRIYAINTLSQGVMIKRVRPSEKEGFIKCVSENERYAPFDVPISDIVAIALVNGSITLE